MDAELEVAGVVDTQHCDAVRFLHPVGKSTLCQGLTVPVSAQQSSWLRKVNKGEKLPVTIHFGEGESATAWLRRINNARGHLQFRYESKQQSGLREFLTAEFAVPKPSGAELLEVVQVAPAEFVFQRLPGDRRQAVTLVVHEPVLHNVSESDPRAADEMTDLRGALAQVAYDPGKAQRHYNAGIGDVLLAQGWRREAQIVSGLGLRVDFERNGVWLEVEFGNARSYYQDYVKFMLAQRFSSAYCGILLCPTEPFAHLLCEIGRKRAERKREGRAKRPSYSGMMTYEKAVRELPYLRSIFNGRIVIAGIHLARREIAPHLA